MIKEKESISVGTAALITGLTLFVPTAPYAEFYVFKKLIVSNDAAQTTQNLLENPKLFLSGIFAIFFTYIKDVLLAWTLYIFLRPVNASLSLLAGWLRIVYTVLAIVALYNFLYAFQLVNMPAFQASPQNAQILQLIDARRLAMNLAYIVFGIYLILVGILIYKAFYVPKALGVLMMLAGAAWFIISLRPYFFPNYDLSWMMIFSVGELVFAIWLLVKGSRIKEAELVDN
ncbi:MAG TPA: DUF4386 domain-containing protein [Flavisolibacter sp.]|jgi:hypothetical protein|nr:DUF4386 domain-containing protein [Flavisolibacter sp.]